MTHTNTDVAIIGAGTAGMVAYREAAKATDSITLIEGRHYGTTCARVGCMPSKLMIAAAESAYHVNHASAFGVQASIEHIDGKAVMDRVRTERDRFVGFVLETIEDIPKDHRVKAMAQFKDEHTLELDNGDTITADRIVIAVGSRPHIPELFKDAGDRLIVNDDVFDWEDLPKSVAVIGTGVIGMELGQALHRLGVRVTMFSHSNNIAGINHPDVLKQARAIFSDELHMECSATIEKVEDQGKEVALHYKDASGKQHVEVYEYILSAAGRLSNVDQLKLENTSLNCDERGIPVFSKYSGQCGDSHIFIAGDADNFIPILHEAADEGRIAGYNAGHYPDIRCAYRSTPMGVIFTDPQIMYVGRSHQDLTESGVEFVTGDVSFENQGRSRVMRVNKGILNIYVEYGSGQLLGAEMIGPRAEHIAHLLGWAIQSHLTVREILEMPFYHPCIEEGVRTAFRKALSDLHMGPAPIPRCMECGPGT